MIENAVQHHKLHEYVNHIICNEKSVSLSSFNQMIVIHVKIIIEFHHMMSTASMYFTINDFFNFINSVKIN